MHLLDKFLDFLQNGSIWEITTLICFVNIFQIIFVVIVGNWMVKYYSHHSISDAPDPLSKTELALVVLTFILNSAITVLGYVLWHNGYITISNGSMGSLFVDMVVFILFIDLSMYLLHRVAHWDVLFPWLHSTHHRYSNPRPLTLFVLNPMETLSFGTLWLLILVLYPSSWPGVFLFLTFNLLFGMMGHLGVEPLADNTFRKYYIKWFSTSTFHTMHHKTDQYNYGFYLVLWDRLLHTLHPGYDASFKSRK